MFYRKIEKEDLSMWEKLAQSEFLEDDFCPKDYIIENWEFINGWILMTDDSEWIGCFFNSTQQFDFNSRGIHFLQICIFPKFRRKDNGKYLMKIAFDKSIGLQKSVCINPNNLPSIKLFEKYGFIETNVYEKWLVYICDKNYYPLSLNNIEIFEKA